jgi:hypothetical protein
MGALPVKLDDSQAKQSLERFLAVFDSGHDEQQGIEKLRPALSAFSAKFTGSQTEAAFDALLAAAHPTANPYALEALGSAMAALPAKLTDSQVEQGINLFLVAIDDYGNAQGLDNLNYALGALTAKLTETQAKNAVGQFVEAMKRTTNPEVLQDLGERLGALPVQLTASQAEEAIEPFLTISKDGDTWLAEELGALHAKLRDDQAVEVVKPFVSAIKSISVNEPQDTDRFEGLAEGLSALPTTITDRQAKEVLVPFLDAIKRTTRPDVLSALAGGLGSISDKLDSDTKKTAAIAVNDVLNQWRGDPIYANFAILSAELTKNDPPDQQMTKIFHFLPHPLTAGEPTTDLLNLLGQVPGVEKKFGGDLWEAVEWAQKQQRQGRLSNLDLDAPLRIQ